MSYTPSPFAWAGFPLTTFTEKDRRYVEMDASEFPSLEDVCRGQGLRALGSASSTRGAEHRPLWLWFIRNWSWPNAEKTE